MKSICVYCGSSPGARPEYAAAAVALGETLAREQITLVYGGSNVGLMRDVADSALEAGGRVVGVMPHVLIEKEVAHRGLTELVEVASMHERKRVMAERADGFIALPGGIGTLEELAEIFVWTQIGIHQKPVALLNTADFYAPLLAFLDHMVAERFLRAEQRAGLIVESDISSLVARMRAYRPVKVDKWLDRR
ncbi:MAG: TIGR00730 family Rossman fold protein [Opitutaceae bacterium]|nr:TIGR00730 family Rossman fold protein [Opitutaceae bacterium]